MLKKVLFLGRPSMGKTTIIKVIFENEDPNILALFPLESTLGKKFATYDFLDLKISVLDTAGQSLSSYLSDQDLQDNIFGDTSKLIYLFDYNIWLSDQDLVINDLKQIYDVNEKKDFGAEIIVFFHKIDLIPQVDNAKLFKLETLLLEKLELPKRIKIYFTSIHPDLLHTVFNAFYNTLNDLSEVISELKTIVDSFFDDLTNTICFITNNKKNIVSQIMTNDFNFKFIPEFHEKINNFLKKEETTINSDNFPKTIEIQNVYFFSGIDDISEIGDYFNRIIIFSQKLDNKKIQELIVDIKQKILDLS
ncbi:MAG: ADP-ribosylation factor-like protein [Promethearchaeota archaeon]